MLNLFRRKRRSTHDEKVRALLGASGNEVTPRSDGQSVVRVDLGDGQSMNVLAVHPEEGLDLDGQPLVRLCGTPIRVEAEELPALLGTDLRIGGFTSLGDGAPLLVSYTTWIDGTDPAALGLAAVSVAASTTRLVDSSVASPGTLDAGKAAAVDVEGLLLQVAGGRRIFSETEGALRVHVRVTPEGVALAASADDGAVEVTLRRGDPLGDEPIVVVSAALHALEPLPPVACQLLLTLALARTASLQLGSFRIAGGRLQFTHQALGSSLTPERLLRLVSFVGETATSLTVAAP